MYIATMSRLSEIIKTQQNNKKSNRPSKDSSISTNSIWMLQANELKNNTLSHLQITSTAIKFTIDDGRGLAVASGYRKANSGCSNLYPAKEFSTILNKQNGHLEPLLLPWILPQVNSLQGHLFHF